MRIAVVGAGVSGIVAALKLGEVHEVTLFEKEPRLGGHAHTHDLTDAQGASFPVDSGFIVYNRRTYPNFVRLLDELGVEGQPSDMSFGARCRKCRVEYSSRGLRGLFAQRSRALDPRHWAMLADIPRFNARARRFLEGGERDLSLREFLDRGAHSEGFVRHFIVPMAAAVWSASGRDVGAFSTASFLRFFENHGWLTVDGAPQWLTIKGGSRTYVEAARRAFRGTIRTGAPVTRLVRHAAGTLLTLASGEILRFDKAVLATHADEALGLLGDPSDAEQRILGRFRYSSNRTVLHTDVRALPASRDAWASWNCDLTDCRDETAPVALTYDMNRLQSLSGPARYLVSLNAALPEGAVPLAVMDYTHPIMDANAMQAQGELAALSGGNHTYYCGAHLRFGFHEDGVVSALRVVEALGARAALIDAA